MSFERHIYCGDYHRFIQQSSELLNKENREPSKVFAYIQSLYDTGAPLYTKEILRDIDEQLRGNSQSISLRGLDGIIVEVERERGKSLDLGDPDWTYIIGAPFIYYLPLQSLLSVDDPYIPRLAFCSMWIFHNLERRARATGKDITAPCQSQEEVDRLLKTNRQAWEASDQKTQLQSIISTKHPYRINKIVAFACGTTAYGPDEPCTIRSAYQHALIVSLRDILTEGQENVDEIKCFAQDPSYTVIDQKLLEQSGITVVDDPQGFLNVDEKTVVLSFAADIPVRQVIADIARPAMMIWDQSRFSSDELTQSTGLGSPLLTFVRGESCRLTTSRSDPDSPRLTKMLHDFYEEIEFPRGLDAFKHNAIYIRNTPLI